jgi:lysozyme family protein
MEANYASSEARILVHEGGYTDGVHPFDPGGCTNFGVTIFDAKKFWKSSATCADVQAMPKPIALGIIKSQYWDVLNCDNLPSGVDDAIVDYGYNSGNSRAGKVLRRLLSLPDTDWHVTDQVITECKRRDPDALINAICDERLSFLQSLAIWSTYGRGWTTRVKEVRQFSTQLADHSVNPVSTPLPTPPPAPSLPQAKGQHPPPSTGPITGGGGAVVAGSGGLAHFLGAHPAVTAFIIFVGVIAIIAVISMIQNSFATKQDAPVAPVVPVPVKV